MICKPVIYPLSVNGTKGFGMLALLVLLIALLPAAQLSHAPPQAQPALLEFAAAHPAALVGVIVQKQVTDTSVEAAVVRLGGIVTKDLHIINAFAAELPARAALNLARMAGVRWVSLDAPVVKTSGPDGALDTSNLANVYNKVIGADKLWAEGYQGSSVTVAVIDSGVASHPDLTTTDRVLTKVKFNGATNNMSDKYGHGTHVAGIIGGDGVNSNGAYIGVAPKVNVVSVKISDDNGAASASDVVDGLQWVLDNKATYNIRVVNLSLNSSIAGSYHTDPIDAAAEILWFNEIVVVVSAGNNGTTDSGILYPPANDPFVITVGATDDKGTADPGDDTLAPFSAYGLTVDGVAKPDLAAPGTNIVSLMASNNDTLAVAHPDHVMASAPRYFRMSGTSMAAPMVAGAVALLLQDEPTLTPDQVKYRLKATAQPFAASGAGAGYLDIYAAVHDTTTESANTGTPASQLLWTGSTPITWGSVNWGSVNWGSVNWGSVNWGSVNWGSVSWGSDHWDN